MNHSPFSRHTIKSPKGLALLVCATLLMVGCSGSVMEKSPHLPGGEPPNGNNGAYPQSNSFQMRFSLQPDEEIYEEAFGLIFNGQEIDPFDLASFSEAPVSLRVRAINAEVKTQSDAQTIQHQNITNATAELSFKYDLQKTYLQNFILASKSLTVVRTTQVDKKTNATTEGKTDELQAEFKAENSSSEPYILRVTLSRKASFTMEDSLKNPWKGSLVVIKNEKSYQLGHLSGFLEPLIE